MLFEKLCLIRSRHFQVTSLRTVKESRLQSLLSLLYMQTGTASDSDVDDIELSFRPALSIAQLLKFNSAQYRKSSSQYRYNSEKETPLSIYIAFLIHSEARNRLLIEKFHNLGLCISYFRMLTLSTSLGNTICSQFRREGIVCPSLLRQGVFTTHATTILITILVRVLLETHFMVPQ